MYKLTDKETHNYNFGEYKETELKDLMAQALKFALDDCEEDDDIADTIEAYEAETEEGYISLYYFKGGIVATQEWNDKDIARIEIDNKKVTVF